MSVSRPMAWCIWLAASIFYAYQNILRVMPNVMLSEIMQQFQIDAAMFGQLSGVYYIAYSLMHIPIGLMLDRLGPKYVLPACIAITTLGLTPILYAEHWGYAMLGRALVGVGSSAAILGTFKIIRMTFEEKNFSKMLGFSVLIGLIGSIYGGGPISKMCSALGYKAVIEIVALAGLIIAAVTYIIMPKIEDHQPYAVRSDLKEVLTNPRVLLVCISAGLMVGPMEGFADVWGATFLREIYGFDIAMASYTTSMIFIGMCVGSLLLPVIADTYQTHLKIISLAGVIMIVCFVALLMGLLNAQSVLVSFFVVGFCCAYQIIVVYKASTYVPDHVASLTAAVTNMIIMIFGYVFHASIGYVVQATSDLQTSQSLTYGISVIPGALTLGVLGFLSLAKKEKQPSKNFSQIKKESY